MDYQQIYWKVPAKTRRSTMGFFTGEKTLSMEKAKLKREADLSTSLDDGIVVDLKQGLLDAIAEYRSRLQNLDVNICLGPLLRR